MITSLTKSDASEGFDQITDFLNASAIQYALTVNPNIYVFVIKHFWSSVVVKKVNDVTRLQALVNRRKVIITKAIIREALHLDDAESINCLPNEEIFTELAKMGYEKPSTKLTFYKAFFASQWNLVRNVDSSTKFYMYPRFLQLMIRAQVGDLSSHTTKYSSPALTQKVFANMRKVGKRFSRVETPLFEGMIVAQQGGEGAAEVNVVDVPAVDIANEDAAGVNIDDVHAADAEPSIPSPPLSTQSPPPSQEQEQPFTSQVQPTPPPSPIAQPPSPQQQPQPSHDAEISTDLLHTLLDTWGIIANIDADEDVTLKDVADIAKEVVVDAEIKENADLMTEVVTAASATITVANALIPVAAITTAPSAARTRKGVVIRDPEDTATPSIIIHSEPKSKDKGKWIMVHAPKPLKKKTQIEQDEAYAREYQALKSKPQTKAQARKNMMIHLRNMAGFKMDYFKGMSYDDIRPIFEKYFNSNVAFLEKTKEQMEEEDSKALKRASESQAKKAAKKQKLDEEVPIVDYDIYTENNKPYYKIIRANRSLQLFLSFLSLLRNFDKEDLEVLWQLVKERFASLKPKNFSDDFLLTTLTYMFEKPDVQAQV
nr:hypothetical protein [Tanacetum cinerariifolium]